MKIIISGATGFAGAHLVRHFSGKGHQVIALGRGIRPPEALTKIAEYRMLDLSGPSGLDPLEADVCIHAAALTSTGSTRREMMQVNVKGTQVLLDSVRCKQFIYISSSSVYTPGLDLVEQQAGIPFDRLSWYGQSKYLAEELLMEMHAKGTESFQDLVIFRPRAIYGTGDRQLLPKLIRLLKGDRLFWPGAEDTVCSLTHIDNLSNACAHSLQANRNGIHIYNICDNVPYKLHETVKALMESISGRKLDTVFIPSRYLMAAFRLLNGNRGKYFELLQLNAPMTLNIMKLKNELGYEPKSIFSATEIGCWFLEAAAAEHSQDSWPWL